MQGLKSLQVKQKMTVADPVSSDEYVEEMVVDWLFADYRSAVLWAEEEKLPKEQRLQEKRKRKQTQDELRANNEK
jgi:hypothetical protein